MKECRHHYILFSSILPPQEMRPTSWRMQWRERPDAFDGLRYYRRVRDFKKVKAIATYLEAAGGKGMVWREVEEHRYSSRVCYTEKQYGFGGFNDWAFP